MPLKRSYKKFNIFAPGSYLLVFIAIGLTVLFTSCTSFDHLTVVTEESFPQATQCGKCHVEIYHEWANSGHAKAYTNSHFREATENYSMEGCLGCHAPEPFVADDFENPRTINRDEGITCVSCHLKEGKLCGPIAPTGKVKPHPIGVNPEFYRGSELCGKCHQGEYDEWENAVMDNKQNCQQCHMSQVTRKVTQATGGISNIIVAFEHKVLQRKHEITIASLELGIDIISIKTKKVDSTVVLTIKNNLPHSLPTGDFGSSVLKLKISAEDTQGNLTVIDQRKLTKELDTAIDALSTLDLQLQVPASAVSLRVQLTRHGHKNDKEIKLADMLISLK
jgi:hypothetical protein